MVTCIKSFGFKHGVPPCHDFILDVRELPNPYSDPKLRSFRGDHQKVISFFERHHSKVSRLYSEWLELVKAQNGTILVGCTGGMHRSVYIANRLAKDLNIPVEHLNYHDK